MRYDSNLQAIVDELGCIAVANVPADIGDIIDGWRKENDKLHDALERQQEVMTGLRNNAATWKNGCIVAKEALRLATIRIAELEAAQAEGYVP